MRVRIRLFARLKDIAGAGDLERDVADGSTPSDVWRLLAAEHPELARYAGVISCAVNEEYAKLTTPLQSDDEVAFLPPVSGGAAAADRVETGIRAGVLHV
jgi:molybdopterin converting factor subunit 1